MPVIDFRRLGLFTLLLLTSFSLLLTTGQEPEPVPTRVPPTLVPQASSGIEEILPSTSTVARIASAGVVRVGMLYNEPPFGELNIRGDHAGFDADLARSLAETWGVEVEFVQVTRQTDSLTNRLRTGEVDMLIAALVRHRELDAYMDFSFPYFNGQQSMMVQTEDPAQTPADLENRTVGVVIATAAQEAVATWSTRTGIPVNVQTYLTLDQAYIALVNGEINAMVASEYLLAQASLPRPELTRILDEPIEREPYAIAVRREDAPMRDLVNRTLQYLTAAGRMDEIHQVYFPGAAYEPLRIWNNLGEDAPNPAQFPAEVPFPAQRTFSRIQSGQTVRVAGLLGVTADSNSPESERRLDTFHRALLAEMAARWGVNVEFVPDSANNAVELVANGQADIAVRAVPDWNAAAQVDFTNPYLLHGERLMVRVVDDDIQGFNDLSFETVLITPSNEESAATRAVAIADLPEVTIRIDEISQQREQDLAFVLLTGRTESSNPESEPIEADAVFGDSLKLIPHVQANPTQLRLTTNEDGTARWYSPSNQPGQNFAPRPMVMAVPNNDIDFRLLVQYTLQELSRDGTLQNLLQPLMLPDEIPAFEQWPGPSTYLNLSLAAP